MNMISRIVIGVGFAVLLVLGLFITAMTGAVITMLLCLAGMWPSVAHLIGSVVAAAFVGVPLICDLMAEPWE